MVVLAFLVGLGAGGYIGYRIAKAGYVKLTP